MADEVKQLTGEDRVDALCDFLAEKHGIHVPEEVFSPKPEEVDGSGSDKYEQGAWTEAGDGTEYPSTPVAVESAEEGAEE